METGQLKVLQKLNEYEFGVSLRLMRNNRNRNNWDYRNLDKYYQTFLGRPILIAYVNGRIGLGHEMKERRDGNGQPYYSFTDGTSERIVGMISEDPKDIWLEEDGDETWIVANGKLFSFYAKEITDEIIAKGTYEISVETEVFDSYMDGDVEVFTEWTALGVTILGSGVAPAIPGANIKALQALEGEFTELKLRAASLIKTAEEDDGSGTDDDIDDVEEEEEKDGVIDVDDPDAEDGLGDEEDDDPDDDDPSEDDETNKPQNKNNRKGEINMQVFSKKQCADLAPKFDGYTVLAAGRDDAGIRVCLMSADGATAVYTMGSLDAAVVPEQIQKINASVSFAFDADTTISVDSCSLTDLLSAELIKANSKLDSTSAELKAAQDTIESMEASEMKRRVSAAKAAAIATLEKFNSNRDEKVDVAVLESINEAIDNGDYSECMNGEGEWCGEDSVCEAVLAKCAKEVMKYDAAQVARNSTHYVWTEGSSNSAKTEDGVSSLIAQWKAKK